MLMINNYFFFQSHFKHSAKDKVEFNTPKPLAWMEGESSNCVEVNLDKQLQAWKENPNWVDQTPKITVFFFAYI